jgi:hypothetical protein
MWQITAWQAPLEKSTIYHYNAKKIHQNVWEG